MSGIHQFQRYSQKEDFVTNNTLLLLSRIYNAKPAYLERILCEMLEDDSIELRPSFEQQISSGSGSRVDGLISQDSVKIVIETKLFDWFKQDQNIRHIGSFANESIKVFILLCPDKIRQDDRLTILKSHCDEQKIRLIYPTFEELIDVCDKVVPGYDLELKEMLEDYRSFCQDHNLIRIDVPVMRVVPCGATFDLNTSHGVYYMPSTRGYRQHRFIGLYRDKRVGAIGKVIESVVGEIGWDDKGECALRVNLGSLPASELPNILSEKGRSRILAIVRDSRAKIGWDLSGEHRFFVVDQFVATEFVKDTSGGIQGCRYYDLSNLLQGDAAYSTEAAAAALNGKLWKELSSNPE